MPKCRVCNRPFKYADLLANAIGMQREINCRSCGADHIISSSNGPTLYLVGWGPAIAFVIGLQIYSINQVNKISLPLAAVIIAILLVGSRLLLAFLYRVERK